ncbi:MAG: hypothetical protein Kow00108_19390 [Calditrichia bacterium]
MKKILIVLFTFFFLGAAWAQPVLNESSFNERTGILTLSFDSNIQYQNVVLNKIHLMVGTGFEYNLGTYGTVVSGENTKDLQIAVFNENNFILRDIISSKYDQLGDVLKVYLDENCVIDENNKPNAAISSQNAVDVTFVENTVEFTVNSAEFDLGKNELTLVFSDTISADFSAVKELALNGAGASIPVNPLNDEIEVADNVLKVKFGYESLIELATSAFQSSSMSINDGIIRNIYGFAMPALQFDVTYIDAANEISIAEALYDEDKNRIEISFNNVVDTETFALKVAKSDKFILFTETDTLSFVIKDIVYSSSSIRLNTNYGIQEEIETIFDDQENIQMMVKEGAYLAESASGLIAKGKVETVPFIYEQLDPENDFVLDGENTYYDAVNHFLHVAFMPTGKATYNTVDTKNNSEDNKIALLFQSKITFTNGTESATFPLVDADGSGSDYALGEVPSDSISRGMINIPANEEFTNLLSSYGFENLTLKVDPFAFINRKDNGNLPASFGLTVLKSDQKANILSVIYEEKLNELFVGFDTPVKTAFDGTIVFDGNTITQNDVNSTQLSSDQKTIRLKLKDALTINTLLNPPVTVSEDAFTTIYGTGNNAIAEEDTYVSGVGLYLWFQDKHKFQRPAYQRMVLNVGETDDAVIYVDVDEWLTNFGQDGLAKLKMWLSESTADALDAAYKNGVIDALNNLFGPVEIGNENGKLVVVLTDVHDNHIVGGNDSNAKWFTPGYFNPDDMLIDGVSVSGNGLDMIVVDCDPVFWNFGDTTAMNSAEASGFNVALEALTDVLSRYYLYKLSPEESNWAVDGLAGLAQLLISGNYSTFIEDQLNIGGLNGVTPFNGAITFNTRDNQQASFTFFLYLYENYNREDRAAFVRDYLAAEGESRDKIESLVGDLYSWFSVYSIAQGINGTKEIAVTVNGVEKMLPNGFDLLPSSYESIASTKLFKMFNKPTDLFADKSISALQINLYAMADFDADGNGTTVGIPFNAGLEPSVLQVLSVGMQANIQNLLGGWAVVGALEDTLFGYQFVIPDSVTNNGYIDPNYSYNGNTLKFGDDFNFVINQITSDVDTKMFIEYGAPELDVDLFLLAHNLNQKQLKIRMLSNRKLFYGTSELPKVYVKSGTSQQELTVEDATFTQEFDGLHEYKTSWTFTDVGTYSIAIKANDSSGQVYEISDKEITLTKFGKIAQTLELSNGYSLNIGAVDLDNNEYILAENVDVSNKYYSLNKSKLEIIPENVIRIVFVNSHDALKLNVSSDAQYGVFYKFDEENDNWVAVKTYKNVNIFSADIAEPGLYFFAENGDNSEMVIVPDNFELLPAYPNPFNPTTNIQFALPVQSKVQVSIYNVAGQLVKVLANDYYDAGTHKIVWDAKNQAGSTVSSGIYFVTVKADKFVKTQKLLFVK